MMKLKITPLNFATAFFIVVAAYSWTYGVKVFSGHQLKQINTAIGWIFLLFAFVVSFMDIMFRNFFREAKKIWIVELSFITLAAIIFLLIK